MNIAEKLGIPVVKEAEIARLKEPTERTCRWTCDGHSIQTECGNAERSIGRWLWCPYCGGKIVTQDVETHPIGTVELLKCEIARLKNEAEDSAAYIQAHDAKIARIADMTGPNRPEDVEECVGFVVRENNRLGALVESLNTQNVSLAEENVRRRSAHGLCRICNAEAEREE